MPLAPLSSVKAVTRQPRIENAATVACASASPTIPSTTHSSNAALAKYTIRMLTQQPTQTNWTATVMR